MLLILILNETLGSKIELSGLGLGEKLGISYSPEWDLIKMVAFLSTFTFKGAGGRGGGIKFLSNLISLILVRITPN